MNILRLKVKSFYDLQKLRIQMGNRDKWENADEIQLEQTDIDYFNAMSERLDNDEKFAFKEITRIVHSSSIWKEFLKGVKGCGETMSSVIMSEFDIYRATTASKMLAVSGIGLEKQWSVTYRDITNPESKKPKIGDWKTIEVWGTSELSAKTVVPRPKEEEVRREFETVVRIGEEVSIQKKRKGQYPSYNNFLKTKLLGVLTTCMIKSKSEYTTHYYDFKQRRVNDFKTKGHLDRAAKRHMLKNFIKDLYKKWRELENLPVRCPYEEEYLGKKHSS